MKPINKGVEELGSDLGFSPNLIRIFVYIIHMSVKSLLEQTIRLFTVSHKATCFFKTVSIRAL